MALPSTAPRPLTGDAIIDAATHGYYWNLGADRTIRWSLSSGLNGETWGDPSAAAQTISKAFSTFSYFANVNFQFTGLYSSPYAAYGSSDINISGDNVFSLFNSYSTWAIGFFPAAGTDQSVYAGAAGDIFINIQSSGNYLNSYAPGSAGYFLFLHEIGHTLGLKHTHDSGGTGRPTLSDIGLGEFDQDWFSVMSYADDYNLNQLTWDPAAPMLLDVLALQFLYGPNMATNAGDSNYTLGLSNLYDTIWDAGGNDSVDASGSPVGWTISLPDIQLSTLLSTKAGIAVPTADLSLIAPRNLVWLTGDIESAYGSRFADTLEGSSGNNTLTGNGGNDSIDGFGGIDTARQSGTRASYVITKTATGYSIRDTRGIDGTDTLENIERIRFSDKSLAFDIAGNAGQAYRMYQAAFNRTPDQPGLGAQINGMDNGLSLLQIAQNFMNSAEFQQRYGVNQSNGDFVNQLYSNVLHRAPDPAGFAHQLNAVNTGIVTRAQLLVNFSESPENYNATLVGIQNGIEYVSPV